RCFQAIIWRQPMSLLQNWRAALRRLKTETLALYFALRDPRTPWYARLAGAAVVAYALSPIDLIPDFVPVLGYLDDLIIVPRGLWLVLRLIPPAVMADGRARAAEASEQPTSRAAVVVIVLIWIAALALTAFIVYRLVAG